MFVSRKFLIALLLCSATAADAATFTVTSVATSGAGSLHQAILDANADGVADTINFAIAGGGLKVIAGNLPAITEPVTIDGYSQPSTTVNTLGGSATNAALRIVLEGSALAIGESVLDVQEGPTTIRGLVLNKVKAKSPAISVGADATGVAVKGCFLGTDATGNADDTSGTGITVSGTATIGTSLVADRNIVSGHDGSGVILRGPGSVVQNNLIGTDAGGAADLGNGIGIQITTAAATGNRIGGTAKGTGNEIAGNADEGVLLTSTAGGGNRFEANRIHANGELGIDLGGTGVTPNDEDDSDTGPNGFQNYPELAFARINGSTLRVEGLLTGAPGQYRIELFESDAPDDSGFGEGQVFRDSLLVTIPPGESAVAFVNDTALGAAPAESFFVTATAASTDELQTSEFSRAIEAVLGGVELTVTNTNNAGAGSLRGAIGLASNDEAPNTIVFDIPGEGPHTIVLSSDLTFDGNPILIDGYSQPGSAINTSAVGTNAQLRIAIDGTTTSAAVLSVFRTTGHLRGIAFHSGAGRGVRLNETVGVHVEGCFLGTDATGQLDLGNAKDGISTGLSEGAVIGGYSRANRNLISGNGFRGVLDQATGSQILNNLIGSDASGLANLGNGGDGIFAAGLESAIGGDEPGLGNLIRGNAGDGIEVAPVSTGVAILGNDIADNEDLGIELFEDVANDGVTANDDDDSDTDVDGANALQNFPVLTNVTAAPGLLTITGSLDVEDFNLETVYRLRFFRNAQCDASGHGEGELFVGALNVFIPNNEQFLLQIPVTVPEGEFLTATATNPQTSNTSEFSECFEIGGGEPAPLCGDASLNGALAAGDALLVLQVAVGNGTCELCVCDTNGSGQIQTGDALLTLRAAVGQSVVLDCPVCS